MSLRDELEKARSEALSEAKAQELATKNAIKDRDRRNQEEWQNAVANSRARLAQETKQLQEVLSSSGIEKLVQETTDFANDKGFYRGRRVNLRIKQVRNPSFLESLKGVKARMIQGPDPENLMVGDVVEPATLRITPFEGKIDERFGIQADGYYSRPSWEANISWKIYEGRRSEHVPDGGQGSAGTSHDYDSFTKEGFTVKAFPNGIQIDETNISDPSNTNLIHSALISAFTGKVRK